MDPLTHHIKAFQEQALRNNWLPLFQEARYRLEQQPIGFFRDDEWLLVRNLATAHLTRVPEQEVLRGLHNRNYHPENVWRDYYFTNRPHIDARVNDLLLRFQGAISSTNPTLPQVAEERVLLPSTDRRAVSGDLDVRSTPMNASETKQPVADSDSLPTPISPPLTLASPYNRSSRSRPKKRKRVRIVEEDISHVQSAGEDASAYSIFGADDSDSDYEPEDPGPLRSSCRSGFPSLRKRLVGSITHESDGEFEKTADEYEYDRPASSEVPGPKKQYVSGCDFTESEGRGRNNGAYTTGDLRAIASLLYANPDVLTGTRRGLGDFLESNLGIRSSDAWSKAFKRRKDHILALMDQMKIARQNGAYHASSQSVPQTTNHSPASVSPSSTLPPTKRPRLTMLAS